MQVGHRARVDGHRLGRDAREDDVRVTIRLVDFGANGTYDPTDEIAELIYSPSGAPSGMLTTGTWMSLDIPLSAFELASTPAVGGLTARAHLAQYVLKSERPGGGATQLWVDNFYFYR